MTERLSAFPGIGRKKAAMAVEILRGTSTWTCAGVERGRVAYDVHVRRVFLRAGLADTDTPEAIEAAAAAACPEAPGTLDLPAWLVGREWCRPSRPDCAALPARGRVCAKRTWLDVRGVGVRG